MHRVQDVHPLWHLWERRQATLLWRLRPRLPHVLPCPTNEGIVNHSSLGLLSFFYSVLYFLSWLHYFRRHLRATGVAQSVWTPSTRSSSAASIKRSSFGQQGLVASGHPCCLPSLLYIIVMMMMIHALSHSRPRLYNRPVHNWCLYLVSLVHISALKAIWCQGSKRCA